MPNLSTSRFALNSSQPFEDPDATFIRSVSYRSTDGRRFDDLYKQITDLKKDANKRDQHKKEMADVVEQDMLIAIKNRRPIRMPDCNMRPAFDGKRHAGDVEIQENGLRYTSHNGQKLGTDIPARPFCTIPHSTIVFRHLV